MKKPALSSKAEGQNLLVNDIFLNIRTHGNGPAFVWGHGLTASMNAEDGLGWFSWQKFSKDILLVRYDARGHGKSSTKGSLHEYSWAGLAKDMLSLAKHFDSDSAILGGQSMGCATAINAALKNPDYVSGLVLVSPPTAWETRNEQRHLYRFSEFLGRLLGARGMAAVVRLLPKRLLPAWLIDHDPDAIKHYASGVAAMKYSGLSKALRAAVKANMPEREVLKNINMPVLILAWEGDKSHPVYSATELEKYLPHASLHVAKSIDQFQRWPSIIEEFVLKVSEKNI